MVCSLIAGNSIDTITSKIDRHRYIPAKQGIHTSFFEGRSYTHEILRGNRTVNLICPSGKDNFRNGIIKIFLAIGSISVVLDYTGPLFETETPTPTRDWKESRMDGPSVESLRPCHL